jgi:oxygen-independent coproporphyrinogen-3 oxidase
VRAAGFENVSIDLIYGIPGQSLADWEAGLDAALELEPDHLSCYALQLALEPDEWAAAPRPGALRWRHRMVPRQDDDLAVAQYSRAEEMLERAGYAHYELSSWALPGRESRHNSAYWARSAYTGLGAGAHSYDGAAERTWNTRDLDRYLEDAEAGKRPLAGSETLDDAARAFEAIALGLRRVGGLSRGTFRAEFNHDPTERFTDAVTATTKGGLLEIDGDLIRLSRTGRLLASEVLLEFVPAAPAQR